jgi:azurin
MKYKQTEFTVTPGATIKLVFDNSATAPSMQHNVVVLNKAPSDEVFRRVGEGGMQAGSANEYVPDDSAVLAATDMSQPGETLSVTFTAPEETGDYGYLCTFPGHWATMQGTMHVKG